MSKLTLDGFFSYCKQIAEHIQLSERMASISGQGTPKLTSGVGNLYYDSILPYREDSGPQTREFLSRVVDVLLDFVQQVNDRNEKILEFKMPDEMQKLLDLELRDEPLPLKQLLEDCKLTLKYQVKTGHPHFFNQLSCGLDIISLAGEWLTAAANTNMFTYEIAPVFILMEIVVLEKMRKMIGWSTGDSILAPGGSVSNLYAFLAARHHKFPQYKEKGLSSIQGHLVMFTSDQCHYSVKSCASVCGLGTDYCVAVPSDEQGKLIPQELERLVRYHKDRGNVPFFVNATSGTTVLGAFDPLDAIADICEKYDMWMHVDAAWGGGLLFSKKYRHPRLTGIERADSVTWNPHKLMGTLLQCSTVHFKYEGILLSCNAMSAEYLFMTDKIYDPRFDTGDKVIQCGRHNDVFKLWLQWRGKVRYLIMTDKIYDPRFDTGDKVIQCGRHNDVFKLWLQWRGKVRYLIMTDKIYDPRFDTGDKVIQCGRHNDVFKLWLQWRGKVRYLIMTDKIYDPRFDTGDKVIQCGRHNDVFKLWLQWRGKGTSGFERLMDRLMELSEYMVRRIKEQPDKFRLVLEPEMVNVSFWYMPKQLRDVPHDRNKEVQLGKVCAKLKGKMMQSGTLMVGYQPDDRHPNFFRNIISSAAVTEKDVDFLLAEIDRLGHDIIVE